MKPRTQVILFLGLILSLGTGCASKPSIKMDPESITALGYTIPQAREVMVTTANPYDISIGECYTMDGAYVPELNQLRLRLINDYSSRSGKKFIEQYNHQTLYPRGH